MADRKRFARGRGRAGSPRETSWIGIALTNSSISSIGSVLNSFNAAALAKRPFTIVRTYLEVFMISDQVVASEDQLAGIGIAVVSEEASTIGATAVPTPLDNLSSDLWLLHSLLFGSFTFLDATGFNDVQGVSRTIDSKAMRKVNDDQDVVVVAESDTTLGEGLIMAVGGRFLIKEH